MCTVTLEYNPDSALARHKLAMLLATGLFMQKSVTPDELEAHREMRDAVMSHSRKTMSNLIARYV